MKHVPNKISHGNKILRYIGRLLCSAFVGMYAEMKIVVRRPKPTHWKGLIVEDIRLFFAPVIGAISGVRKALRGASSNEH